MTLAIKALFAIASVLWIGLVLVTTPHIHTDATPP